MLSSGLFTDLYQLTMAYGYWKTGRADRESVFHLFFRRAPFEGGYAIAAGQEAVARHLTDLGFSSEDLEYLESVIGDDHKPLFDSRFLDYLGSSSLRCDVDSVAEGAVVFPHEPILRVRGGILECQLLETALLNLINFPTLIATKASRICRAAGRGRVLEFGLRRAHGIDGGLTASRAAYIGGVDATSNVIAGKRFGIPVKGTHAHSWVMAFPSEREAFRQYVRALPQNCTLLVDTYDTRIGIENALEALKESAQEWELDSDKVGLRLDSGDLVELSQRARKRLDEEGFENSVIVASGDLDERSITQLESRGARIDVWGIGTKLATGYPDAALGGVYKLGAIRDRRQAWRYVAKHTESSVKASIAGNLAVARFTKDGRFVGDVIYDAEGDRPHSGRVKTTSGDWVDLEGETQQLLRPLIRSGEVVDGVSSGIRATADARSRAARHLQALPEQTLESGSRVSAYPVGLSEQIRRIGELARRSGGGGSR